MKPEAQNLRQKGQKCGAKTRSGKPCQRFALAGKMRCRLHGGNNGGAGKGNVNALRHGIYSNALLPGEDEIWDSIELGKLDDELKLMRIRMRRLVEIQNKADAAMLTGDSAAEIEAFQVEQLVQDTEKAVVGGGSQEVTVGKNTKLTKTRRDYHAEIRQLARVIGDLELKRSEIVKRTDNDNDINPPTRIEVTVTDARKRPDPPSDDDDGGDDE